MKTKGLRSSCWRNDEPLVFDGNENAGGRHKAGGLDSLSGMLRPAIKRLLAAQMAGLAGFFVARWLRDGDKAFGGGRMSFMIGISQDQLLAWGGDGKA